MKKFKSHLLLLLTVLSLIVIITSCKKSSGSNNSAITKENLAGSYTLTALTITVPPLPAQNIIDSVPDCQRDDTIKLKVDLSMQFIDAGIKCVPPGDGVSTWALSGNTITVDSTTSTIKSFDGKTLVVTTNVTVNNFAGTTTETLTKH
jgi:hypothetical protein